MPRYRVQYRYLIGEWLTFSVELSFQAAVRSLAEARHFGFEARILNLAGFPTQETPEP